MIQKMIVNQVLKVVDNTIGKKFKIIDKITDQFQGLEPRIEDLEKEVKQLREIINENNNAK